MTAEWKPTDEQWYRMCDSGLSHPFALKDADLTKPFVYDRKLGFYYVGFGQHDIAMRMLFTIHHGELWPDKVQDKLGVHYDDMAEEYLKTISGTCYKSAIRKEIVMWNKHSLSIIEKRIFYPVADFRFMETEN